VVRSRRGGSSLLFGLVATGQVVLRKLDGYTQLAAVIRQRMRAAA
jgi:hypothetical protein